MSGLPAPLTPSGALDIGALEAPLPLVQLPDGTEVVPRRLTAALLERADREPVTWRDVFVASMPDVPPATFDTLTPTQVAFLLALIRHGLDAAQAALERLQRRSAADEGGEGDATGNGTAATPIGAGASAADLPLTPA